MFTLLYLWKGQFTTRGSQGVGYIFTMEKLRTILKCDLLHQVSAGGALSVGGPWNWASIPGIQVTPESTPCDDQRAGRTRRVKEAQGGCYLLNFLSFLNILAFLLQHLFNIMKPIVNFIYFSAHCIWWWTFQDFTANLLQGEKDIFWFRDVSRTLVTGSNDKRVSPTVMCFC